MKRTSRAQSQFMKRLFIGAVILLVTFGFTHSKSISLAFALFVDISYFEISLMFLAAWFFSWAVCSMTLPGVVIMEFENLIDDVNSVKKILILQKYKNKKNELNLFLPEIPEFMKWEENAIKMHINEKEIILTGPVFIMEMVAHKLIFENM